MTENSPKTSYETQNKIYLIWLPYKSYHMLPLSCLLQCSHTGILITVNQMHQVYSNLRIFARSVTSSFLMAASSLLKSKFKPHFFKEDFLEYTV